MSHEKLDIWKSSMELAKKIYIITVDFPKNEQYGITSQMRRAAVSVPSNIVEGSARNSDKEMVQFLYIAQGSLAELETQLLIAASIGYIDKASTNEVMDLVTSCKKLNNPPTPRLRRARQKSMKVSQTYKVLPREYTIRLGRTLFTIIHYSPSAGRRTQLTIHHHSPLTIHHSLPFTIHHSPFTKPC